MAETPWEPPLAGTEVEHLLGALDRQRATFRWKADAYGRAGLSAALATSTMTLGGLLKHLALVEDSYASIKLHGVELGEPWTSMPGSEEHGFEWSTAAADDPAWLYALYDGAVERARQAYAAALLRDGLDQAVHVGRDQGLVVSLRRLTFDLLEEYARHTGHADLLSEAAGGRVGEDPPPGWRPLGAVDDGPARQAPVPRFEDRRMAGAVIRDVDLTGADLRHVDLSGATVRAADLSGSTWHGVDLVDVTITAGDLERVTVNDVDVAELVGAELDRRDPDRPLTRPADADGFRRAWDLLERRWAETVEHARRLPPERLHASVAGEWSFVETLRHLVFATECWVGRGVRGEAYPWGPLSLPWDEAPDAMGFPRDRAARPSLDKVLALRAEAQAAVRTVVDGLTDDGLDVVPAVADGPGWPPPGHTVRQCLLTVLNEEYAHRLFAERDLAVLEEGGEGP
ncbi:mycothiol transferase [Microlunatus flavus]|uniref:Pentapeptide repeat-containing protein n=1 Tax=Microlunatus flavus TaxID=1036181 RepID=A0A1H9NKI2_9ACTN|nr:DUF664 domain-containing protein [Microlunatus flavus]SER36402.1 Pentapeptide repeat-containing protein [Microlunatus flavus]